MASETDEPERTPEDEEEMSVIGMHEPIARETDEPRDGFDPIPTTLIFLFFVLVGWGGWYLGEFSGDFRRDVFAPGGEKRTAAPPGAEPEREVSVEELGTQTYAQSCAACHQADGQGVGRSFPPLAGSEWVVGEPEVLARIVLHGVQGPIEVAGRSYNGQMPGWGDQLDDEEVAAVLTHERASWGNDAPAVSAELVAAVREQTAGRGAQWTAEELADVEPVELEEEPEPEPEPETETEPETDETETESGTETGTDGGRP
ncbi:MAG: c-type cytochrome [Polyangiales bacterium]